MLASVGVCVAPSAAAWKPDARFTQAASAPAPTAATGGVLHTVVTVVVAVTAVQPSEYVSVTL